MRFKRNGNWNNGHGRGRYEVKVPGYVGDMIRTSFAMTIHDGIIYCFDCERDGYDNTWYMHTYNLSDYSYIETTTIIPYGDDVYRQVFMSGITTDGNSFFYQDVTSDGYNIRGHLRIVDLDFNYIDSYGSLRNPAYGVVYADPYIYYTEKSLYGNDVRFYEAETDGSDTTRLTFDFLDTTGTSSYIFTYDYDNDYITVSNISGDIMYRASKVDGSEIARTTVEFPDGTTHVSYIGDNIYLCCCSYTDDAEVVHNEFWSMEVTW